MDFNKKQLWGVAAIALVTIIGLIIYVTSNNKSKLVKCSEKFIKDSYGKKAECKIDDDEIKCNFSYNNFDTNMYFKYDTDKMKIYGKYFIVGNLREDDFNITRDCK